MKHPAHVSDGGRVEARRLVERICFLPRIERGSHESDMQIGRRREGHMRSGAGLRDGRPEGVGRRRRKRDARGKARLKAWGPQGTRGAHVEHVAHGRDLGGVEAQRLVERRRALPSRKEGHAMRGEVRAGRREGVGRRRRKRRARGGKV